MTYTNLAKKIYSSSLACEECKGVAIFSDLNLRKKGRNYSFFLVHLTRVSIKIIVDADGKITARIFYGKSRKRPKILSISFDTYSTEFSDVIKNSKN